MKSVLDKIHPNDWKYVAGEPDADFDPEHNKRVIESTIKSAEVMRDRKRRENAEGIRERADALAKYLMSL